MKPFFSHFRLSVLLAALCVGCASQRPLVDESARAAQDLPDHFLVGTIDGTATSEPEGGTACRNPMVDPRDGTRLTLIQSRNGLGDYEVPDDRYGVGRRELLRLECGTGEAIGIVRR